MGAQKFQMYKVRRVDGFANLFQVCKYGLLDGIEIIPGFFDSVKPHRNLPTQ